jgi:hypothetical protein
MRIESSKLNIPTQLKVLEVVVQQLFVQVVALLANDTYPKSMHGRVPRRSVCLILNGRSKRGLF